MAKEPPYYPPNFADAAAYASALERELAGYRAKIAEWKAQGAQDDDSVITEARSGEKAVLAELKRVGHGQEVAEKRPAAKTAEKR
jgi:hypothetical protein